MIYDLAIKGAFDRLKDFLSETPARNSTELNEALGRWISAAEIALVDVKMAHWRYLIDCSQDQVKTAGEELEYLQDKRNELTGDGDGS